MAQQINLFPIELVHEEPYHGGTKHLSRVGWDLANSKFAIKSERDGTLLPLTEWISYHLCRFCSIPTPDFEIVRCVDGSLAFGVRWVHDATQIDELMPVPQALSILSTQYNQISAILTLDRFLPNIDRHVGNFFFVTREGTQLVLSFDYSLAGARIYEAPKSSHPFGAWPLPPDCNTNKLIKCLPGKQVDPKITTRVNNALANITRQDFENILNGAPDEWFTIVDRAGLMHWWDNESTKRIPK